MVEKISIRQIQWHQERSLMVTGVGHVRNPKTSELRHFWTARVTHFVHRLWPFMVSLYLSCQYLFLWYRWCLYQSFDVFSRSFYFLFLLFLHKLQGREKREKNKEKITSNAHRSLITTQLVLFKISWLDESNDTK